MALQIRRGLEANLPVNPAEGELLYATDSGNLYIGVSGSPNIINLAQGGGGGNSNVQAISDLSDVGSISGITNGQALLWNASANEFQVGTITVTNAVSDLSATNWAPSRLAKSLTLWLLTTSMPIHTGTSSTPSTPMCASPSSVDWPSTVMKTS